MQGCHLNMHLCRRSRACWCARAARKEKRQTNTELKCVHAYAWHHSHLMHFMYAGRVVLPSCLQISPNAASCAHTAPSHACLSQWGAAWQRTMPVRLGDDVRFLHGWAHRTDRPHILVRQLMTGSLVHPLWRSEAPCMPFCILLL